MTSSAREYGDVGYALVTPSSDLVAPKVYLDRLGVCRATVYAKVERGERTFELAPPSEFTPRTSRRSSRAAGGSRPAACDNDCGTKGGLARTHGERRLPRLREQLQDVSPDGLVRGESHGAQPLGVRVNDDPVGRGEAPPAASLVEEQIDQPLRRGVEQMRLAGVPTRIARFTC